MKTLLDLKNWLNTIPDEKLEKAPALVSQEESTCHFDFSIHTENHYVKSWDNEDYGPESVMEELHGEVNQNWRDTCEMYAVKGDPFLFETWPGEELEKQLKEKV